ncbi:MAG: hypothetical protein KAR57_07415 [Bacteroidales bacterium]|nr:hypothetical protein [Bacteroidales bacterium]
MKKYFKIILSLSLVALLFVGCEETRLDKSNDYDFNSIEPYLQEFALTPGAPIQMGRAYDFTINEREGATYEWIFASDFAEVNAQALYPNKWKVSVYFTDSVTPTVSDSTFTVQETYNGKVSNILEGSFNSFWKPYVARAIVGSPFINEGFTNEYTVEANSNDEVFSTWKWTTTAGTLTVDPEKTWLATLSCATADIGPITLKAIETNKQGLVDTAVWEMECLEYCALENGAKDLAGTWSGLDAPTLYSSGTAAISIKAVGEQIEIDGINADWILNFWGEEIVEGGTCMATVNADGTIEILEQYIFTCLYDGEIQDDYTIVGAGRWNNCGEYPTITIQYELTNYDTGWADWCYVRGYIANPLFDIIITLDPETKKVISTESNTKFDLSQKPVR